MRRFFCLCDNVVSSVFLFDRLCCMIGLFRGRSCHFGLSFVVRNHEGDAAATYISRHTVSQFALTLPFPSRHFINPVRTLLSSATSTPKSHDQNLLIITKLPQSLGPSRNHQHHLPNLYIFCSFVSSQAKKAMVVSWLSRRLMRKTSAEVADSSPAHGSSSAMQGD